MGVITRVGGYMNDGDYTAYSRVYCTFKGVRKMTHSHCAGVWVPGSVTLSHSCDEASEGGPEGHSSSSSSGTETGPFPSDEGDELTSKLTSCITSYGGRNKCMKRHNMMVTDLEYGRRKTLFVHHDQLKR